jgi:pyrophosphatase PpaX
MPALPHRDRRRPTVLFDLDGTLIDTIELILSSARYAFGKLGREYPSDAEWTAGIGIPLFTMFGRYAHDPSDQAAFIAAYREYQLLHHDRLTRAYTDAATTIATLHERGHEIGIVTSKSEALALRGLSHVGLARFMDTIVGCDGSPRHKPDPEPVRIALHRLACSPEDAMFVGDSVHDIIAGNGAGVTTVAATWGAFKRADLEPGQPNFYLESISELPELVEHHRSNLSPRGAI